MNFYFDTLDNEMLYVAQKMIAKYNIKNIYAVTNPVERDCVHDIKDKCNGKVRNLYVRQKVFLSDFKKDIFFDRQIPLDGKILKEMSVYEGEILKMAERNGYQAESYNSRTMVYHKQLMYWNTFLELAQINVAVFCFTPHSVHDYIIYRLCQLKGIITVMAVRTPVTVGNYYHFCMDHIKIQEDLFEIIARLKEKEKDIKLEGDFKTEYDFYVNKIPLKKKSGNKKKKDYAELVRWHWKYNKENLIKKISNHFWEKIETSIILHKYNKRVRIPDFSRKYIYFPLQYQPEMTTSPMAGVFVHQYLAIQMLAFYVPKDVTILVKEHPIIKKRTHTRDANLYRLLDEIANVQLVPMNTDSQVLIENACAVASMTGTVGYEAMYKEKYFLMFGDRTQKYALSTINIRNNEDCKNAMRIIFEEKKSPTLADARIYLKALEETAIKVDFVYTEDISDQEREENANKLFKGYSSIIDRYLP